MCVFKKYKDERDRCDKAIDYYKGWKEIATNCNSVISELIKTTNNISEISQNIILNEKPIDEGPHFSSGNASSYSTSLGNINNDLEKLINALGKTIDELNISWKKSDEELKKQKHPCKCHECQPQLYQYLCDEEPVEPKSGASGPSAGSTSVRSTYNKAFEQSLY